MKLENINASKLHADIKMCKHKKWGKYKKKKSFEGQDPAGIYLLKVNNRNTRTRCEICSKLTIKTLERR